MRRVIFQSFQSPGDVLMLTAAIRDLHAACPREFVTDVRTSADALWTGNPWITRLEPGRPGVEVLDMHYPLIHTSDRRPVHFLQGYHDYLEQQFGRRIPVTQFRGDIHLTPGEKQSPPDLGVKLPERFWIIMAGGKYDFTAKWWNPASYQAVVDHFRGRIAFLQCGEAGHWHPPLQNVIPLVGRTTLRQFVQLMHHADGVVCPVTFAMHLAAAVETKTGRPALRPCVVIAGGREPPHWEAYPGHQFLHTVGQLPCCATGGCWKSRCQPVGDGDAKDQRDLCERPVQVRPDLRIPYCMDSITPQDVIRKIEQSLAGASLFPGNGHVPHPAVEPAVMPQRAKVSVSFHHGLGDCAYFTHLIPLYRRRGFDVEVECTPDKRILFAAAGATVIPAGTAAASHAWGYPSGETQRGHGDFWRGSKIGHNISESPLPDIGPKPELWPELCAERIDIRPHLSTEAVATAKKYLGLVPGPVILLHSKGNTAQNRKSLPDDVALQFYQALLDQTDASLILLDWDRRVPRLANYRVRHLDDLGSCSLDVLLALIDQADLMIGVDSGPLHVARFTRTPTVGIWMPGHYPSTYTLPRREQLNVVLADVTRDWNRFKRIPWNLVEHPGSRFDPDMLAGFCAQMLSPPRYLGKDDIAADVQLQHWVGEWCRGTCSNGLSTFCDRHRSFDRLLTEATRRFERPTFVETGTIRAEEDWAGAGFSTYHFGAYVSRRGGKLHSVDLTPGHVEFARNWTHVFGDAVTVHQDDSLNFLQRFPGPIDVLYLDSLDTTEPRHAEHALREVEVALPKLHERSLILFDDTPWNAGNWVGKGSRAVPWLLERGWRVLYAGYQVLLTREEV